MKKLIVIIALSLSLFAENLTIASGGGYKKPMMEIYKLFKEKSGIKIDGIFGNMRQILMQSREGRVSLVVGDKKFLQNSNLKFEFKLLGYGKLVLAYPKGSKIKNLSELKSSKIKKIATPQPKKAIYGKASHTALNRANLMETIKDKLYIVATVPQVSSYLITKEVDAGFINLTDALGIKDKIGGYFEIEQKLYDKIEIVGGILKKDEKLEKFLKFLDSSEAKNILAKYGLKS